MFTYQAKAKKLNLLAVWNRITANYFLSSVWDHISFMLCSKCSWRKDVPCLSVSVYKRPFVFPDGAIRRLLKVIVECKDYENWLVFLDIWGGRKKKSGLQVPIHGSLCQPGVIPVPGRCLMPGLNPAALTCPDLSEEFPRRHHIPTTGTKWRTVWNSIVKDREVQVVLKPISSEVSIRSFPL